MLHSYVKIIILKLTFGMLANRPTCILINMFFNFISKSGTFIYIMTKVTVVWTYREVSALEGVLALFGVVMNQHTEPPIEPVTWECSMWYT